MLIVVGEGELDEIWREEEEGGRGGGRVIREGAKMRSGGGRGGGRVIREGAR
jgi:hypothetical protein